MKHIIVCVPTGDTVHTDFCLSVSALMARTAIDSLSGLQQVDLLNIRTSVVEVGRFMIVRDALARGADATLFLDSDMVFPENTLARLLAHDKPIVGATYIKRRDPFDVLGTAIDDIPPGAKGIAQMARMPFGCMLIRREVYDKVPRPWFQVDYIPEDDSFLSEDFWFCDRAREAGFDIWCDLDLSHDLGHCGQQVHWWGAPKQPFRELLKS